jgi:hypothetical protein
MVTTNQAAKKAPTKKTPAPKVSQGRAWRAAVTLITLSLLWATAAPAARADVCCYTSGNSPPTTHCYEC